MDQIDCVLDTKIVVLRGREKSCFFEGIIVLIITALHHHTNGSKFNLKLCCRKRDPSSGGTSWLITLLLTLLSITGYSQNVHTRIFDHTSGLSDHIVHAVYVHPNGMVFIGTGNGVDLFDGFNLIHLNRHPQLVRDILPYGKDSIVVIRSNSVLILHATKFTNHEIDFSDSIDNALNGGLIQGDFLYCSSNSGLIRISLKDRQYTYLTLKHKNLEGDPYRVFRKSIVYDPVTNSIYQGSSSGLLQFRLQTGSIYSQSHNPFNNEVLNADIIPGEMLYHSGSLWMLSSSKQILEYQIAKNHVQQHPAPAHFPVIRQINQEKDHLILRLSGDSFAIFHPSTLEFKRVQYEPGKEFSALRMVHLQDGSLVFGGVKGLAIMKAYANPLPLVFDLTESFGGRTEFQNIHRMRGKTYIQFQRGIAEYDPVTQKCVPYIPKFGISKVYQIVKINEDTLLLAGSGGYECFDIKSKSFFKPAWFDTKSEELFVRRSIISAHFEPLSGYLILNVNKEGMYFLNRYTGKSWKWNGNHHGAFRSIRAVDHTGNNKYVLGAQGNDGLAKVSLSDQGVKVLNIISPRFFNKAGFHTGTINDILQYKGEIYFASTSGMGKVDFEHNKLIKIALNNGFTYNDEIYALSYVDEKLIASGRYNIFELNSSGSALTTLLTNKNPGYLGAVFSQNQEWMILSDARMFRFNAAHPPKHEGLQIALMKQCETLYSIQGKSEIKVEECPGELILFFSFKKFAGPEIPFDIQYRILPDTHWQSIQHYQLHLTELQYGYTTIEYRVNQWGRNSHINTLKLYNAPPWYSGSLGQIVFGLLLLMVCGIIAAFIVQSIKRKNARNMQVLFNSIEEERQRIGREFHDAIGPNLSSIKLLSEYLVTKGEITDKRILRIPDLADKTISEIRNILNDLSPETLKTDGLHAAVFQFIDQLGQAKPNLNISLKSNLNAIRFDEKVEFHILRIIQELIHNAVKHSEATYCQVDMNYEPPDLRISVVDNGIGLNVSDMKRGNGFRNIGSRTQLLGGKFTWKHLEAGGTQFDFHYICQGDSSVSHS